MLEQQFTEKTQELLGHAQFKAQQAQHPEVGEDHLLIALIEKERDEENPYLCALCKKRSTYKTNAPASSMNSWTNTRRGLS